MKAEPAPFAHRYVGPEAIRERALKSVQRAEIKGPEDVRAWCRSNGFREGKPATVTVTFIVDTEERLWIADRRSEHVACANGGDVFAGGELTFTVDQSGVEVLEATNQSTGYCPQVAASWNVLSRVLDRLHIPRPRCYTSAFEFRRCEGCGATNLIKDDSLLLRRVRPTAEPSMELSMISLRRSAMVQQMQLHLLHLCTARASAMVQQQHTLVLLHQLHSVLHRNQGLFRCTESFV